MRRPSTVVVLLLLAFGGWLLATAGRSDPAPRPAEPRVPIAVKVKEPPRNRPAATARVSGLVLDALGFRIVGAEVRVDGRSDRLRTDAEGSFTVEVPLPGPFAMQVAAAGKRAIGQRLWPTPDPLVAVLEPLAPWDQADASPAAGPADSGLRGEGFVRDEDGNPLVGAVVSVVESAARTCTDAIGRYVLPLPPAGATLVVQQPEGGARGNGLAARSEALRFPDRPGLLPLPELRAGPGAAIRGTLRDGKGQPVAGAPLRLRGEGIERCLLTGADGVFRFAGLLAGRYALEAFAWRGALGAMRHLELTVPVLDCELQLVPISSRRLQVVQEDGAPVPRAYVASAAGGLRRDLAQADDQGFAEVKVATAPDFEVRAAGEWRPLPVRRFDPEAARLVVALP